MSDERWVGPQVGAARRLDWIVLDALEPFDFWPSWSTTLSAHLDGLAPSDLAPGPLRALVAELYRPVLFEWWRLYQVLLAVGGLIVGLGSLVYLLAVVLPAVQPTDAASPMLMNSDQSGMILFMLIFYPTLVAGVGFGMARVAPSDGGDLKVQRAAAALAELRSQDQLVRVPRGWIESVPTGQWAARVLVDLPVLQGQIGVWRERHPDAPVGPLLHAVVQLRRLLREGLTNLDGALVEARAASSGVKYVVVDWEPALTAFHRVESLRHGMDRYDRVMKALPSAS